MLSFVIPAHDEAALIGATIRAIQGAATELGEHFEVIVVDDASSDDTAGIAGSLGAQVVRVAVRQISVARNVGAAMAHGDFLLFVDADTLVDAAVVRAAVRAMRVGAVGGGAAVRFDEPTPRYARTLLPVALWANRLLRLASGCFLFCTRQAFGAVGGFDASLFAAEEVVLSRALRRQGRFVVLREAVVTSGRKLRTHSAWQIIGTLIRLALAGRRGLRDRGRLPLWYGPRPPDPRPAA